MSRRRKGKKESSPQKGLLEVPHRAIGLPALIGLALGAATSIGGALYVGLSTPPPSVQTSQRITYHQAQQDPSLRAEYVRSFNLAAQYPFLRLVDYAPNLGFPMVTTSLDHPPAINEGEPIVRIGQRSSVYVGPQAFTDPVISGDDDFLSVLADHEIEGHARYFSQGFPGFTIDNALTPDGQVTMFSSIEGNQVSTLNPPYELFAYEHQLSNPHGRRLSQDMHEKNVKSFSQEYINLIRLLNRRAYRDPRQIEDLATRFVIPNLILVISPFPNYTGPTYCDKGHIHATEGIVPLPSKAQQRIRDYGARPCAVRQ